MFINICFLIQDINFFLKILDILISFDFYLFFSQFTNVEVNNFLHNHVTLTFLIPSDILEPFCFVELMFELKVGIKSKCL